MYHIKVYAHEDLERTTTAPEETSALRKAYALIGSNGVRVAHVIKDGTQGGIYIARATDLDRASFSACVATLRQVEWRS